MSIKTRITALTLSGVMALSLFGCGTNANANANASTNTAASTAETTDSAAEATSTTSNGGLVVAAANLGNTLNPWDQTDGTAAEIRLNAQFVQYIIPRRKRFCKENF